MPDDLSELAELDEFDDLAPTMPSMPRVPRVAPPAPPRPPLAPPRPAALSGRKLQVAADFAEYMLRRDWLGAPHYLARLTMAERVALVALVERVYLPALTLAGRADPRGRMTAAMDDELGPYE